ncbi:hypothetical protein NW752_001267 [Fusarium irregulare]|uniref:Heterokaryon incompatibility domain-containing protein n=1 Tax=Fusarium irregulare TaxID=2494466 RepID=A0A9W8PGM7_9HYPO|nr:hypothetical protein NW766_010847 [Fusarium irregulare]KAJ4026328.1 hypothetical protein NW752_001267 [Fusarium irregulare]
MSYIDGIVTSIKEWLSFCDWCHATCKNASNTQSARPSWLIDVRNLCIVQGNVQGRYIALSYTWFDVKGLPKDAEPLQLTSSNIHGMKTPGILRKKASKLPDVIKEAMELTARLGERWLWVDRLCIVQDGPQKESECMRMNHIYSGAYLTIVAATIYDERDMSNRDDTAVVPRIRGLYQRLGLSRWAKRAWTYQEYILSKRVVFFLKDEIFWQCETSIWDQVCLLPYQDEQPSVATLTAARHSTILRTLGTPAYPDFELYRDIICPYNGRDLSYQEDGLAACLGILNKLEPAFPGGFIFGLPRLYLDHALLWQPLKRPPTYVAQFSLISDGRMPTQRPSSRRPSLPSWAWCGWQCFVDPTSLLKAFSPGQPLEQESKRNPRTLQNLVTWKPVGEGKHEQGLSQGSEASSSQSNLIIARVSSAHFFSAATLALRVAPTISTFPTGGLFGSAFVSAQANPVLGEKPLEDSPKVVVIQDHSGMLSGLLRVTGHSTRENGQEMKLIAVSQGRATGQNLNESYEAKVFHRSIYHDGKPFRPLWDENERWVDRPGTMTSYDAQYYVCEQEGAYKPSFDPPLTAYKDEVIYDFMNIFWVEDGEDGVSYRAGCGYVLKDRWEAMTPTETEVILG